MSIRAYLDTSVFGGTQDKEFATSSMRIFGYVMDGRIEALISQTTITEIGNAPAPVRRVLEEIGDDRITMVELDERVENLAYAYVDRGVLAARHIGDALHVAAATVGGAHVILSWNFKHIVNYRRIGKFNAVNIELGHSAIEIRSPLEIDFENEEI